MHSLIAVEDTSSLDKIKGVTIIGEVVINNKTFFQLNSKSRELYKKAREISQSSFCKVQLLIPINNSMLYGYTLESGDLKVYGEIPRFVI